ncbi:hypothetical protein C1645_242568 [Glomus cerebriforme]|uniref:Uncharacterized protein n=1 Tax=Glomus cerebriforme TaxID=658196 RepID=A0A397SQN0_9GLOM|nr:hypothetical protein C1645_242568 [Glomus cerebriforme]
MNIHLRRNSLQIKKTRKCLNFTIYSIFNLFIFSKKLNCTIMNFFDFRLCNLCNYNLS